MKLSASVRSIVVAALIGVAASVSSIVFLRFLSSFQEVAFITIPDAFGFDATEWWWLFALVAGATALLLVARRMPGETGGSPLHGFHFDTPIVNAPGLLLAALATLVAGISLGPEAPLIIVGSTTAALLASRADQTTQRGLMFLGGIAAISTVFGSPLITAFIVFEFVALGLAPAALMLPALAALGSGFLTQTWLQQLTGTHGHSLSIPKVTEYAELNPFELVAGLAVAVVASIVVLVIRVVATRLDRAGKTRPTAVLVITALVSAAVAIAAINGAGLDPRLVLFSGNAGMPVLMAQSSVLIVLLALVVKASLFTLALGGGFRGGTVFPATFVGLAVAVLGSLLMSGTGVSGSAVVVIPLAAAGIAASAAALTGLAGTSTVLAVLLLWAAGPLTAPFALFGAIVGWIANRLDLNRKG